MLYPCIGYNRHYVSWFAVFHEENKKQQNKQKYVKKSDKPLRINNLENKKPEMIIKKL